MDNNILYLEEEKKLLILQQKYETGLITEDEMTIEEINSLISLYVEQTKKLKEFLNEKLISKTIESYFY